MRWGMVVGVAVGMILRGAFVSYVTCAMNFNVNLVKVWKFAKNCVGPRLNKKDNIPKFAFYANIQRIRTFFTFRFQIYKIVNFIFN